MVSQIEKEHCQRLGEIMISNKYTNNKIGLEKGLELHLYFVEPN